MVIGKSYKENNVLLMILFIFLLSVFSAGIVLGIIFIEKLSFKITIVVVLSLLVLLLFYIPYIVYRNTKISDILITYDSILDIITIYGYKKKCLIKTSDILKITLHNIGISSTSLFIVGRTDYGKLCFYLKDGRRIKTLQIEDCLDVYDKLKEIVFIDRENEFETKLTLDEKLDMWGSKKDYPIIVSILVAIFLPIIGCFFVKNQADYKEFKNGKISPLMSLSIVISAFWIIALVVTIYLL